MRSTSSPQREPTHRNRGDHTINYPTPFAQRVLVLEAPGGEAAELSLVAPSVCAPGEPARLKIAVLDALGYPSVEFEGLVRVSAGFARPRTAEIVFKAGLPAVGWIAGFAIPEPGLYRFEGEADGLSAFSNPVHCREDADGHRLFWGDPHVHTILGRCHPDSCRSLNFCFFGARHMTGLDWVSAADHVSNGRCEFAKWKEQMVVCDAHDDPPDFVTLPAYEASLKGGCGGDNNVYLLRPPEMYVDQHDEGDTRTLCEGLAEAAGEDAFFIVPHHTTRTGKHGEIGDAIYPGETHMPVVEIHSKWGTSEYRGNPNPLQKIHPGPSYVVDLLNQGLRLGFVGGTDSHATMPSAGGEEPGHIDRLPGLTAVRAPELTRAGVFEGIRRRDCYATSRERVILDVDVAGASMGQAIPWPDAAKRRRVRALAAGKSDLVSLEVVRNGETIHRVEPGDWRGEVDFTDEEPLDDLALRAPRFGRFVYYYLRATCASNAQAWSSPVWLALP